MRRPVISRDKFVACIEKGIENAEQTAGTMPEKAKAKLRRVGAEAKLIGVGMFALQEGDAGKVTCHCPLSTAGLTNDVGDPRPRSGVSGPQVAAFASTFDAAVSSRIVLSEDDYSYLPSEYAARIV